MGIQNICQRIEKSVVDGTNDREAYPKFWIAVLVQMNCEKKVESKLNKLGLETYLPVQKEEHQWSDRKRIIERNVIPMVVFVRVDKEIAQSLRSLNFIHKLVAYPGSREIATPIPDEQMNRLKFLLSNADSEVSIASDIEIGDEVRVVKGALKGLVGILYMKDINTPKVAIRIDCLGYASVSIPMSFVEKK